VICQYFRKRFLYRLASRTDNATLRGSSGAPFARLTRGFPFPAPRPKPSHLDQTQRVAIENPPSHALHELGEDNASQKRQIAQIYGGVVYGEIVLLKVCLKTATPLGSRRRLLGLGQRIKPV
jgi:hypothetical protein